MTMAKVHATMRMPAHQARAIQVSVLTGCWVNRSRIALTMDVTGWYSAKARTGPGMVSVGTNAELTNGRKMSGWENATAPSADFAERPGITAIHVNARVNRIRMPATASHASTPAPERKPIRRATSTTTTSDVRLATSDVPTCAHSTDDRGIGIDWKRSTMPLCMSLNSRNAV